MTDVTQSPKRTARWRYALGAAALALLGLLAIGLTREPGRLPSALVGQPMPAFEIAYLEREGCCARPIWRESRWC